MGASAARENAGDSEAALVHLQAVVDDFGTQSSYTPRALFNVGRINEVQNNIVEASEAYNRLIDDYPTSSWTNLARNRIITLTIQGRIGEE
jgi:TolA-binding protein